MPKDKIENVSTRFKSEYRSTSMSCELNILVINQESNQLFPCIFNDNYTRRLFTRSLDETYIRSVMYF